MVRHKYYFNTRDVLLIAALAGMGGATAIIFAHAGASLRAVVGFPGGLQVFAGVHVIWLVLAGMIVPRYGAATVAGLLKGAVELMLGSPHGLFVVIVSASAGLLIDFFLLAIPRRLQFFGIIVGAAFAAASNVVIFQLFAQLPSERMIFSILFGLACLAGLSGALLAGLPALLLVRTLRRAGVITQSRYDIPNASHQRESAQPVATESLKTQSACADYRRDHNDPV